MCRPAENPHSGQTIIEASSIDCLDGRPAPRSSRPCCVWAIFFAVPPRTRFFDTAVSLPGSRALGLKRATP